MRKLLVTLALGAAALAPGQAASFVANDQFPGTSCGTNNAPVNDPNCDVIGDRRRFDVQRLTFNIDPITGDAAFVIRLNYNFNDITLGRMTDFDPDINIGDVLFQLGGLRYGLALTTGFKNDPNGRALTVSQFYQVAAYYTGQEAFGGGGSYRRNEFVSINHLAARTAVGTAGAITSVLAPEPSGYNGQVVEVTATFNVAGTAFLNTLYNSADDTYRFFAMQFASATCGNDIVTGGGGTEAVPDVPEPVSMILLGSGLLGMGLLRRRPA